MDVVEEDAYHSEAEEESGDEKKRKKPIKGMSQMLFLPLKLTNNHK